jgi:hypothetical protein
MIKVNFNHVFSLLNTSILLYTFYTLSSKITTLKTNLADSITAVVDSSYIKFSDQITKKIGVENQTLLEGHLDKMREIEHSFSAKHGELIKTTSAKTDLLVSRIFDAQITASQKFLPPSVNIVQESNVKPLVIGAVIIVSIVVLCTCYFAPKIAMVTNAKFTELQWVFSEILRYIPGSNSATGTCHLDGAVNYRISTQIISGIPKHTIYNTQDGSSQDLAEFIIKLSRSFSPNTLDTLAVADTVVTLSGAVQTTGLL